MKILFKNANILDVDTMTLSLGSVVVENDIIKYVGKDVPLSLYDQVIDCEQNILMPGFVDAHCHSAMTLLRGVGDDKTLQNWQEVVNPMEDSLAKDDVYWGTKLAVLEYLANGITSIEEGYFVNDEIIKAVEESGLRARIGFGPTTRDYKGSLEDFLQSQLDLFKDVDSNRIKPCVFVHSIYVTNTEEIEKCVDFSAKHNLPMSIHLSETLEEVGNCTVQNGGLTPPQYLESLGFFDRKTLCYHCVNMDKDDLQILADYNASICTCPSSNIKLASGIAPVYAMQNKGINITIGTDGASSNNCLDMFKEMFLVATLSKVSITDASVVHAEDVLKMATINGANALGFNCGEIKVGKKADIIVVDIHCPHMYPHDNLISSLVYSARGSDVKLTMVDGKILYKNGKYTNENIDLIYKKVNEIRERLKR